MTTAFDQALRDEVLRDVLPGEQLVWWGRPCRSQALIERHKSAFFSLLGVALFTVTGVVIFERAVAHGEPFQSPFMVVPLLIALLMPLVLIDNALVRRRAVYGLTNRRALVITRGRSRHVRSVTWSGLVELSLVERRNGIGTITFGDAKRMAESSRGRTRAVSYDPPTFDVIENARLVYEQAWALHEAARDVARA
jgi:hypothetical protein